MKTLGIITIVWVSVCTLVLLILHLKSHRFLRSLFLNAILGFSAMALINLTHKFTGVFVPINWWTVGGGGVLGLPCVCGVVLLQLLV